MFAKDSRTENFLTQMGVQFRYSNAIKFSDLAKDWGEKNLARPVPKRDEAIIEYAALMDSGSAAPAPILHNVNESHDILDGVQRIAAAEFAGYTNLSAYIVECDSHDVITAIRVLANARLQGRPEPPEWTRRRAVEVLVIDSGMSPAEVAKMGGWRVADVEKVARILGWTRAIVGIGGPDNFSDAMTDVISQYTSHEEISKEPALVCEFFSILKQSQLSATDAQPFLERFFAPVVKVGKLHQTYKERLDEFRQEPEVVTRILGRRRGDISRDVNLRRLLKSASTVLDEIALCGEPLHYADEFFQLLSTLKDKVHRVSKNRKPVTTPTPADKWVKS